MLKFSGNKDGHLFKLHFCLGEHYKAYMQKEHTGIRGVVAMEAAERKAKPVLEEILNDLVLKITEKVNLNKEAVNQAIEKCNPDLCKVMEYIATTINM
jgi:hypothetical protein